MTKVRTLKLTLIIIFLYFNSFLCFGEVIYLKDGRKIEGKITARADDHIIVEYHGIKLKYGAAEIECITKDTATKAILLSDDEYKEKFMQIAAKARNSCEVKFMVEGKVVRFADKANKLAWKDLINYYEGKRAILKNLREQLLELSPPPQFFKMHESLRKSFAYAILGYRKAILSLERNDAAIMDKEAAALLDKAANLAQSAAYNLEKTKLP